MVDINNYGQPNLDWRFGIQIYNLLQFEISYAWIFIFDAKTSPYKKGY
jgi:hypothetical protein